MDFNLLKSLYDQHVLPTYNRADISFVRGDGVTLYDSDGNEYLDFTSGIGVCSVGHSHPAWVAAVSEQAAKLAHVSNLYHTEPGGLLAQRLCTLSGMEKVFFANSGAEANEGLIKLAKKHSFDRFKDPNRYMIATLSQSFHGRTHVTLAATGQDVFHQHFQPLNPGFVHIPPEDISALEALDDSVCAVLIEPVRGEGGVLPCSKEYLKSVQNLCETKNWLFMLDEVQTGIGRCGNWFAFQEMGLQPDAVSFAKGIAGGLPLGGFLVGKNALDVLTPGLHATTYGGNPICCAAALATLDILKDYIRKVEEKGRYIRNNVEKMNLCNVKEIRGMGLMLGIAIKHSSPSETVATLRKAGLLCLTAGTDAIRLLPPLTITYDEIDKGLKIFEKVMKS